MSSNRIVDGMSVFKEKDLVDGISLGCLGRDGRPAPSVSARSACRTHRGDSCCDDCDRGQKRRAAPPSSLMPLWRGRGLRCRWGGRRWRRSSAAASAHRTIFGIGCSRRWRNHPSSLSSDLEGARGARVPRSRFDCWDSMGLLQGVDREFRSAAGVFDFATVDG